MSKEQLTGFFISLSLPLSQLKEENVQLRAAIAEVQSRLKQSESDKLQLQTRSVISLPPSLILSPSLSLSHPPFAFQVLKWQ